MEPLPKLGGAIGGSGFEIRLPMAPPHAAIQLRA